MNGLLDILLHQHGHSSSQAAGDILALLVGWMYSGSDNISQKWQPLAKFAGEVLQSLTGKVLDFVLKSPGNAQQQKGKEILKKQSKEVHQENKLQNCKQQQLTPPKDAANNSKTCEVVNMYQLVLENPRVSHEALEGYFSAQLIQTLTHCPDIKLTKVLKEQEVWHSAKTNRTLVALLQKVSV